MKYFKLAAMTVAMCVVSCKGTATGGHDHDHEHEHEEKLQVSAYSDRLELYLVSDGIIAGETVGMLAHLTSLEDFKPLVDAQVSARLVCNGSLQGESVAEMVEDGIYSLEFKPEKTGDAVLELTVKCGNQSDEVTAQVRICADDEEADEEIEASEPHSSNGVAFPKEKSWMIDFSTAECTRIPVGSVIRTMAQVILPSESEYGIAAGASGMVSYAIRDLVVGSQVRKGQVLFTIDGGGVAGDNLAVRFADAESQYRLTKAEYERAEEMAQSNVISASQLQQARSDYERAKAVYESLSRNYSNGKHVVKAPQDGYIDELPVANGQYVEAGQQLACVSDLREVHLKAEVQSRYYSLLGNVNGANLRRMDTDQVYSLESLGGHLVSFGRVVSQESPLVPVTFCMENSVGLVPGSFVEMFIKAGADHTSLAVPSEAIVEEMGECFVFVQLTPEFFEKRLVRTGKTDGLYTEILQGVAEGERVVAKGAVMVKLSQASGALDPHAGHNHG
ncbi:MAG: efflux RND transporter periplasmic adaptor subunit [Bacteroidaceae bacterium]|nr:efflux RND transporter periplasmic adaptor subunit [Bacteroidaceae bacterium]